VAGHSGGGGVAIGAAGVWSGAWGSLLDFLWGGVQLFSFEFLRGSNSKAVQRGSVAGGEQRVGGAGGIRLCVCAGVAVVCDGVAAPWAGIGGDRCGVESLRGEPFQRSAYELAARVLQPGGDAGSGDNDGDDRV